MAVLARASSNLSNPFRNWGGEHKQQGDLISLLLFFQNKESRLKNLENNNESNDCK
jgi:hypothetical protein